MRCNDSPQTVKYCMFLPHKYTPNMPAGSRKSRDAKKKRHQGRSGFAKRANAPSPNSSVYHLSDSDTDAQTIDTSSSNNTGIDEPEAAPLEGLQRLYTIFLPPHLRLNEDRHEKHQRVSRRSAVYTRDSRTTAWRKAVAQKKATEGCTTLNAFVLRKVGSEESD